MSALNKSEECIKIWATEMVGSIKTRKHTFTITATTEVFFTNILKLLKTQWNYQKLSVDKKMVLLLINNIRLGKWGNGFFEEELWIFLLKLDFNTEVSDSKNRL